MAKSKLQITMDSDLLADVDLYCEKNHMNRSWMISQAVVQLVNQQKMVDSIINVSLALKKAAEIGCIDDETKKQIEFFEVLSKMFVGK